MTIVVPVISSVQVISPRKKAKRREGDETSEIGMDPRSKAAIDAMTRKERRRSLSRSKYTNLEDSSDIAREREMNVLVVDVFKSPKMSLSKTRPKRDILRVRY